MLDLDYMRQFIAKRCGNGMFTLVQYDQAWRIADYETCIQMYLDFGGYID